MKKLFSLLLCLFVLASVLPTSAVVFATEADEDATELVTVFVSGGTATERGKSDASTRLSVPYGTAVTITATDFADKTFAYWKTDGGDKIGDKTFDVYANRNIGIYACYSDWKGDFGEWTLCPGMIGCEDAVLSYREDSATGLREYSARESSHDFDWNNEVVIKEATCTEEGEAANVCSDCGYRYVYSTPASHKMGPSVVVKKASGAQKGISRSTCELCGYHEDSEFIKPIYPDKNLHIKYKANDLFYGNSSYWSREEEHWVGDNAYMYYIFHNRTAHYDNYQCDYLLYFDHGENSPVYVRTVYGRPPSNYDSYRFGNNWAVLDYVDSYDEFVALVESCHYGTQNGANSSRLEELYDAWADYFNIYGMERIQSVRTLDWTYADFTLKNATSYYTTDGQEFIVDENNCCYYHSDTAHFGSPREYDGITLMEDMEEMPLEEPDITECYYFRTQGTNCNWTMHNNKYYIGSADGVTFNYNESARAEVGKQFDHWEIYDWDTDRWVAQPQTSLSVTFGAVYRTLRGVRARAPLYVRAAETDLPKIYSVTTTDGLTFNSNEETEINSLMAFNGQHIYLNWSVVDEDGRDKYIDHFEVTVDGGTTDVYNSNLTITGNTVISPVFYGGGGYDYGTNISIRYGGCGQGYFGDDEECTYLDGLNVGDKVTVHMTYYDHVDPDEYDFVGWFYVDSEMDTYGDLISTEPTCEVEIIDTEFHYIAIEPVFKEKGGKDPTLPNKVTVTNSWVKNGRNWSMPVWTSSILIPADGSAVICDMERPYVSKWVVTSDGEESYEIERDYGEYYLDIYGDTHIEGIPSNHTDETHEWGDWYNWDTVHMRECPCGVMETQDHIDEDGNESCDVCGADLHKHVFAEEYQSNPGSHWKVCACGETAPTAPHIDANSDGLCDVCGYNTHIHVYRTYFDTEKHWKNCDCGNVMDEAAHVDENSDGFCDVCGYEDRAPAAKDLVSIRKALLRIRGAKYFDTTGDKYFDVRDLVHLKKMLATGE
ncbi:MAG: hypothetical protein MJ132_03375 [Clostridia bacterium]|nr:hypothetical protein [Clostridia bacterium]